MQQNAHMHYLTLRIKDAHSFDVRLILIEISQFEKLYITQ